MSHPTSPHDHFFKAAFTRPDTAADLLRQALPEEVVATLDLLSVKPTKSSFVDPHLRDHYSDLLFEATGTDGSPVLVYLLVEHKSHPEHWVVLELLRYALEAWRHWRKGPGKGEKWLPPLIPMVLYHGEERWKAPREFAELVAGPELLNRYRPRFQFELLDLSTVADERLPAGAVSRAAFLALKYIHRPEMRERVREIVTCLRAMDEEPGGLEYIRTLLNYLIIAARELETERLRETVNERFREEDGFMATIAEQWIQEGIEKGIQQGMQQGMQQGRQQGILEGESTLIERQLTRRFGPLPEWVGPRLAKATPEQLEQWADRLLDAPDLEAVFTEETH
ncbi:Rpn family recombination-promoting nuclease/putative transposase [Endothiovibrio diazotrophicus]